MRRAAPSAGWLAPGVRIRSRETLKACGKAVPRSRRKIGKLRFAGPQIITGRSANAVQESSKTASCPTPTPRQSKRLFSFSIPVHRDRKTGSASALRAKTTLSATWNKDLRSR